MAKHKNLKSTQLLLAKLIQAPSGVADALKKNPQKLPIVGNEKLSPIDRLDIYANMYFFRIRDALKEDFPKVLEIVGEENFHNLVTGYLLKYPSKHWSLRYVGQHFANYLKAKRISSRSSFLSDLAKFEWALIDVFDGLQVKALSREELLALGEKKIQKQKLKSIPSLSVIKSLWPLDEIFSDSTETKNIQPRKYQYFLIWRQGLKVLYRKSDGLELKFLNLLSQGTSIANLCHQIKIRQSMTKSAQQVFEYLNKWLAEEILWI